MQPIMTLYDSTSSAELTTMERAGDHHDDRRPLRRRQRAAAALKPRTRRRTSSGHGDNFMISGAYTGDTRRRLRGTGHSAVRPSPDDERTQFLGRLAYRLWSDGVSNIQIGASGAQILSLQGITPTVDAHASTPRTS